MGHSQVRPIVSNLFSFVLSILRILAPAPQSYLNGVNLPPVLRSPTLQGQVWRFVHQLQAQEREVRALAVG